MVGLRAVVSSALMCLWSISSWAGIAHGAEGWELEGGVDPPRYAVISPQRSNLNIDSIVLAGEEADGRKVLQMQIYLSTEGPLSPDGFSSQHLKHDPQAEVAVDGLHFPVGILFAGDHVVLADETEGMIPRLSQRLLDSMEHGSRMMLRFDLVAEPAGEPASFDGEVAIVLQAGSGGKAVAAVRRCASPVALATRSHARR